MSSNTFYNEVQERSIRARDAKNDEKAAKLASDDALRVEWLNTNWSPIVDKLVDAISLASAEGKFRVTVEVDSKTFGEMSVSPLFRFGPLDWSLRTILWGFVDMISNQDKGKTRSLRPRREIRVLEFLWWDKRGVLNDFRVTPHDQADGGVFFDISWHRGDFKKCS
jgi:hypothetical protein